MSTRAKFVREVTVIDPDTKGEVEISIYKHENGGMFGIDTSYVDQVLSEDSEPGDDLLTPVIPDPFATFDEPQILYLEEE
jgi:hypothetical protein